VGRHLPVIAALWLGLLGACASVAPPPSATPAAVEREAPRHVVHVISHGWHTGIVINRASLAESGLMPEVADFPEARYLEFGWGDRDFYMSADETLWITVKAALVPSSPVMHVAAVARVEPQGRSRDAIGLTLSGRSFRQLVRAISASLDRPADGAAEPIAPGLGRDSRFYPARGRFHLLNTCNTWTATMLYAAGLPVSPKGVITAGTLMRRVRHAVNAHGAPGR
jgi:uncharacterized protein (TIGR02117 family)